MEDVQYCSRYDVRNLRGLTMIEIGFSLSLENTPSGIRFLLLQAEKLMASTVITV